MNTLAKLTRLIDRNARYVLSLPAVIFVLLMIVFPLLYTAWISLHNWNFSGAIPSRWVGLQNFTDLLAKPRFWNAAWNTVFFSFGAVFVQVVLGIALATLLNRKFKMTNLAKTVFLLPMVSTPVAIALVWLLIFEPTIGLANYVLEKLHLPELVWLNSGDTALLSLMLVDIWQWTPMVTLIILAGITTLPSDPYESALVDGATRWQMFWKITFPLLIPTIIVAFLLRMIDALKTFDLIYATTQGGPAMATETLNIYGYVLGFQFFTFGPASALILLFLALVTIISLILLWIRNKAGVEH